MDTIDLPVPHDRTAQRLGWVQLTADLRESLSASLDSPASRADEKYSRFSPGLAAVVHTADTAPTSSKPSTPPHPWRAGTAPRPQSPSAPNSRQPYPSGHAGMAMPVWRRAE
ncbi:hypothetical protein [Catellatospora paridis]